MHKMNLHSNPFNMMKTGLKTIELRLNDEKRSKIKTGDQIEFTNSLDANQKIITEVLNIYPFDSFELLYKELPLEQCGYKKTELKNAKPSDMDIYYSKEQQNKYGVLGIKVIIKNVI